jgi:hypothetical protein
LFSADDAHIMEWLDDVRLYEIQGYGAEVNYAIAGAHGNLGYGWVNCACHYAGHCWVGHVRCHQYLWGWGGCAVCCRLSTCCPAMCWAVSYRRCPLFARP